MTNVYLAMIFAINLVNVHIYFTHLKNYLKFTNSYNLVITKGRDIQEEKKIPSP